MSNWNNPINPEKEELNIKSKPQDQFIQCPRCNKKYKYSPNIENKVLKCKECDVKFLVLNKQTKFLPTAPKLPPLAKPVKIDKKELEMKLFDKVKKGLLNPFEEQIISNFEEDGKLDVRLFFEKLNRIGYFDQVKKTLSKIKCNKTLFGIKLDQNFMEFNSIQNLIFSISEIKNKEDEVKQILNMLFDNIEGDVKCLEYIKNKIYKRIYNL